MCIGFLLFGPSTSASFQYPPLVGQRHGRSRWCLVSGPPPKVGTDCWRINTTRCKCPFHHLLLLRPCDAFATTVRERGRTQANMAKDLESMASREPASLTNKKKLKVLELYFNSKRRSKLEQSCECLPSAQQSGWYSRTQNENVWSSHDPATWRVERCWNLK